MNAFLYIPLFKRSRTFFTSPVRFKVCSPEGTYLLWLDCAGLGLKNEDLNQFFLKEAKLRMNMGYRFGEQADTFMRLNIGCPRKLLEEGLARIEKAIKNRTN